MSIKRRKSLQPAKGGTNSAKNVDGARETSKSAKKSADSKCTVVGFGASAGGLEAFSELLSHVPADLGMALVFIQHLDAKHSSYLPELLSRATGMPVHETRDGMAVEADHVYVIPPNANLVIRQRKLNLLPRSPSGPHMPVDTFFRSLAEQEGSKAIGVILSGTASDGTLGLKAIKAEAGITFCQDPESAKYDGMPRSAIAAGCVDFVLPPHALAAELARLCRHPYVSNAGAASDEATQDFDFNEIFGMLRAAMGVDFTFYKPATIRRRILRRMALNRIETPEKYIAALRQNRGELDALFRDILINVTGFFREPELFEFLKARVFPPLLRERSPDEPVRIWVPGCSTGEEAYSVAMALIEYMRDNGLEAPIQIFGTDLSEGALEKARAGVYPESIAGEVSNDRLRRFFVKINGSYQIARGVRDLCVFARQNLTKDPPFSKLDLITCRNVLIYLGPVLQQKLMRVFHYALKPNGFLALGISETVGAGAEFFEALDRKQKVYSRKNVLASSGMHAGHYEDVHIQSPARVVQEGSSVTDVQRKVDQFLLSRYSPPGVVVDSDLKIVQFRGRTSPFLEHSAGDANLNLLRMTRGGLGMEIRKLVQRARSKETTMHSETLQVGQNETLRSVRVSVTPIKVPNSSPQFVVLFEEPSAEDEKAQKKPAKRAVVTPRARELEQELAATKLYLQSVIEEQEAATEELKSANEEIQSSNEELQSTNEELLTAKEELQSTNEELTTVNEEMQSRNAELSQINDDLSNLLSSVNIPIVMLGNDLRIRRFTPQAEKVLNLLPTDIGRPISDFKPKISVPELENLFTDVIENLTIREGEVQDREGRAYSMWIRPYRTADNRIDGAVMALFDVTERKSMVEARYRRLFEAAPDGILIVEARTAEVLDANPFMASLVGLNRADFPGRRLWDLAILSPADLQDLTATLADRETWHRVVKLTSRTGQQMDVEIVANVYPEGERQVIQLNVRDLPARRRDGEQLRIAAEATADSQRLQAVGRLAGSMARDFNNFLTTIIGFADVVEHRLGAENPVNSEVREIKRAGERAAELTRQLMAFGRTQTQRRQLLDMNHVVSNLEQVVRILLPGNVTLHIRPSKDPVPLLADRFQIEQILMELVTNSREAMPKGGTLTIETSQQEVDEAFTREHPAIAAGEYAVLQLSDTGNGDGAGQRAHLFGRERAAGLTGFEELSAAVRLANGSLWSYSEMGKGTTFRVYFPRGAEAEPETPVATLPASASILLVDPDYSVRRLAANALRDRGYKVFEAPTGPDALRSLREERKSIDLLISDVLMPNMSGLELADRLQKQFPELNVLYVSGDTDQVVTDFGVLEEGRSLLRKPFTAADLAARVQDVLQVKKGKP